MRTHDGNTSKLVHALSAAKTCCRPLSKLEVTADQSRAVLGRERKVEPFFADAIGVSKTIPCYIAGMALMPEQLGKLSPPIRSKSVAEGQGREYEVRTAV